MNAGKSTISASDICEPPNAHSSSSRCCCCSLAAAAAAVAAAADDDDDEEEEDEADDDEDDEEEVDAAVFDVFRKRGKSFMSVTNKCMKQVRAARTSKLES